MSNLITDYGGALLDAINGIQDIPSRGLFLSSCYTHDFASATWRAASYRLQDKVTLLITISVHENRSNSKSESLF